MKTAATDDNFNQPAVEAIVAPLNQHHQYQNQSQTRNRHHHHHLTLLYQLHLIQPPCCGESALRRREQVDS